MKKTLLLFIYALITSTLGWAQSLPTVTTDSVNNITANTAFVSGTIINNGGDSSTVSGFCFSTSPNPTVSDSLQSPISFSVTGPSSTYLSGLTPNTTYYVRAYATNVVGTSYGNQLQFTTANITLATTTTDSITGVTATTATVYGNTTDDGMDPGTYSGICYSTSPNPTIADSVLFSGLSGTGLFNVSIDSLTPNTTFYVRAYTTNMAGTSYGNQLQFSTGNATLPAVTSDSINAITATTAIANGTITNDGNDPNTIGGICYSASPNPTIADSIVTVGTFTVNESFSTTTAWGNLTPNTTYYVRAYATNVIGTSYGSQLQFITGNATLPVVTSDSIIILNDSSVRAFGNMIDNGNDPNDVVGFCYSISPNPTTNDSIVYTYAIRDSYYNDILGLTPNTTYYLRAYVTNVMGTSYGSQLQVTTNKVILSAGTNDSVGNVTATTAVVYGAFTNSFNLSTDVGFCYSTSPNPTIADSIVAAGTFSVDANFSATLSGLTPNVVYYMNVYGTNSMGTWYGTQLQFATDTGSVAITLPIVTTDSINSITATTATAYGTVTNEGNDNNTLSGMCFSTSPNPTIADSVGYNSFFGIGSGFFKYALPKNIDFPDTTYKRVLIPNTTYYVRAYATNAAGIAYGNQLQFTTGNDSLPIITTDSVTKIGATSATVYISLKDDGNDPNIIAGFCISKSPNPTNANIDSTAAGSFQQLILQSGGVQLIQGFAIPVNEGFTPNTTYYVRAFATNGAGTSYGGQLQFTTVNCFAYYATTYDTLHNIFTLTVDSSTSTNAIAYRWDFGDGSSSTLATPSHTYTADTTYNVCLNVKGANGDSCSYCNIIGKDAQGNIYRMAGFSMKVVDAVASHSVAPLAIENNVSINEVSVFPNPTAGNLTLTVPTGVGTVTVYNVIGEKVYQSIISSRQSQIDLSAQQTGVYFINIQTDRGTVNKKIIVNH